MSQVPLLKVFSTQKYYYYYYYYYFSLSNLYLFNYLLLDWFSLLLTYCLTQGIYNSLFTCITFHHSLSSLPSLFTLLYIFSLHYYHYYHRLKGGGVTFKEARSHINIKKYKVSRWNDTSIIVIKHFTFLKSVCAPPPFQQFWTYWTCTEIAPSQHTLSSFTWVKNNNHKFLPPRTTVYDQLHLEK